VTLVVAGDVMCDVVASLPGPLAHGSDTPAPIAVHGGGSAANVAAWAAAAGVEATLVARVGDDELGRAAVLALRAAGVRALVETDPRRPTGTCIVLVHPGGERSMIPDAGANVALELDGLPPGRHLHLPGYALLRPGSRAAARRALAHALERGMTVSVDPSSSAPLATVGAAAFLEWVEGAGLLVPNAEEARVLTGEADPEAAALALARGREVVVTLGAEGALWTDGEEVVRVAAEPTRAVDTTGAGDAFAAGLLAARLDGADPAAALAAGCRLAARAVASIGARPPLPGYD
jgi:ribokinase